MPALHRNDPSLFQAVRLFGFYKQCWVRSLVYRSGRAH
ncbi:Uncharacterised protein [Bordetella pertussis]|nr:Uncharacterised protein [Bordetella pertussis]